MTLTNAQLSTTIYNTTSLNTSQSARLVETLIEIITSTLASGEDVMFSSFGKFHISNNNHKRVRTKQNENHVIPGTQRVVQARYYKNDRI